MRRFKLQVFTNRCADCDFEFESLHLRGDYQPVLYGTVTGVMQYLDADEDPVWPEVEALVKAATKDRTVTEMEEASLFHDLLATTVDPPAEGGEIIPPWATSPCPRCGSGQLARGGPVDPPQFREVTIPAVTHERWQAMSPEAKYAGATQALARHYNVRLRGRNTA